ncbi:MAG: FixH family protein [Emcibacter sp.]|nr:FixH family protein [Emcibacter sp.]
MSSENEKSQNTQQFTGNRFTGKKALMWIVGFFLVIFTVNGIMAYFALGTWGGLETENSYRKGIHYNEQITAAEKQAESGWEIYLRHSPEIITAEAGETGRLDIEVIWPENDLPPAKVTALITRAVTNIYDQEVILTKSRDNLYTAPLSLPLAGQWNVEILVKRPNGDLYKLKQKISVAAASKEI